MPLKKYLVSVSLLAGLIILNPFHYSYSQEPADKFEQLREKFKLEFNSDKPALKPGAPAEEKKPETKTKKENEPEELPGMVYVPEGEFIMGTNKGFDYESPEHTVYLKGFYIDKYEVTNVQYKRFVDYTGYTPPKHWKNKNFPSGKGYFPVTNISCRDAEAYAKWAGKRLPTEEEWKKPRDIPTAGFTRGATNGRKASQTQAR